MRKDNLGITRLSKHDRTKKRIFFMHVGKCGGTSITAALQEEYQSLHNNKSTFFKLHPIGSREAAQLLGRNKWAYRNDLAFYFMSNPYTSCVAGHFKFNEQLYQQFKENFAFVTVLREPVSHFLSTYFYNRYKTHTTSGRIYDDLDAFLNSRQARKIGCRYISFLTHNYGVEDHTSSKALDIAVKNIEKFDLVGVLESLPLFTHRFEELFGKALVIPHKMKSPKPKHISDADISPVILERIRELCQPNQKLYDFVVRELITQS